MRDFVFVIIAIVTNFICSVTIYYSLTKRVRTLESDYKKILKLNVALAEKVFDINKPKIFRMKPKKEQK